MIKKYFSLSLLLLFVGMSLLARHSSGEEPKAATLILEDTAIPESESDKRQLLDEINEQIKKMTASVESSERTLGVVSDSASRQKSTDDYPQIKKLLDTIKNLEGNQLRQTVESVRNLLYKGTFIYSDFRQDDSNSLASINELRQLLGDEVRKIDPFNNIPEFASPNSFGINPGKLSQKDITTINESLSPLKYEELKRNLAKVTESWFNSLKAKIAAKQKEINGKRAFKSKITTQLEKKTEINSLAIKLGLPLFCLTVIILFLAPFVIKNTVNSKDNENIESVFSSGVLTEVITILLLTMSILILGLAGKIEGPVLGTLLGGISGYVLNRLKDKKNSLRRDPNTPE